MEEISAWLRNLGAGGERPALISFQVAGRQVWSFERLGRSIERVAAGFASSLSDFPPTKERPAGLSR